MTDLSLESNSLRVVANFVDSCSIISCVDEDFSLSVDFLEAKLSSITSFEMTMAPLEPDIALSIEPSCTSTFLRLATISFFFSFDESFLPL